MAAIYGLGAATFLVWTLVVGLGLAFHIRDDRTQMLELAREEAEANFKKDVAFRYWATSHGGVYVPVTERTRPSPYLAHVPERDIATPSGKALTLMNPATMLNQMMGQYSELYGVRGHITDFNPLNPANEPDDWELAGLKAFERGETEVRGLTTIDGKPYLRIMQPLDVEAGCLKCHEHQGYKEGVKRGGVSVAVPLARRLAKLDAELKDELAAHGVLWALVLVGIGLVVVRSRRRALERARALRALGESEERFRRLFEGAPLAYQSLDEMGRCLEVNEAWLRMTGYRAEEVVGRDLGDFLTPAHRERMATAFPEFLRAGLLSGVELDVVTKSGDIRSTLVEGRVNRDTGQPAQTHCILIDVTEQRRSQEALRKLSMAVEHSPITVLITDAKGIIEYVNPRFVETSGYSREEALGRSPGILRSGFTPEHEYRELWTTIAAGQPWQGVFCNRRKDGALFWEEAVIAPVTDDGGVVTHYIAFKTDITARRQTEERLRQSEDRLRDAQRIARLGNWTWDVATGELFWSEEIYRLFGRLPTDFEPSYEKFFEFVHPEDVEAVRESEKRAFAGGEPHSIDHRIVLPDGTIRWMHEEAIADLGADGKPIRLTGTVQDITGRKEAEETLRRAVEELARANIELERFAHIAANDLQEPLRNIVSYSQLLNKRHAKDMDGDARDYLALIIGAATRMRILVGDLMTYSRLESRTQPLRRLDMGEAIAAAEANLHEPINETGARIEVAPMPEIKGDEVQMSLVFQHLIGNALKFRREGVTPRVEIGARLEGGHWLFSVKDNGIGIEAKYTNQIFDAFKRLHPASQYPGTGIGLAICRRVVDRHGGRIWAESTPGEGSTFLFSIPVRT